MKIVKRYSRDMSPSLIRELTATEETTLYSVGSEQQALLDSLYGSWLLCTCASPVTIKKMSNSNQYFLARVQGRKDHEKSCRFASLLDESHTDQRQKGLTNLNAFSFSQEIAENADKPSAVSDNAKRGKVGRTDKLYALVAGLIESSGANQIALDKRPNFFTERDAIRNAALRYTLGSKSLKDYLFFGFGSMNDAVKTLEERKGQWIGRHRPQALLLAHVMGVSEDDNKWVIHVKEGWDIPLQKKCYVTRLNGAFSLNKGPILIAAIISYSEQKSYQFGITRCFVSPVVSEKGFMMIDSDLERTAAKIALKCILSNQSPAVLKKPLLPTFVDGVPVLPDFVVKNANRGNGKMG